METEALWPWRSTRWYLKHRIFAAQDGLHSPWQDSALEALGSQGPWELHLNGVWPDFGHPYCRMGRVEGSQPGEPMVFHSIVQNKAQTAPPEEWLVTVYQRDDFLWPYGIYRINPHCPWENGNTVRCPIQGEPPAFPVYGRGGWAGRNAKTCSINPWGQVSLEIQKSWWWLETWI